jgi:hypothetical protein
MFGGVINIANMLPYGAFCVSQDPALQESLFRELEAAWPDPNTPPPSYDELAQLPILKGVVKESLRLMHGIIVGPPRLTPSQGAVIDGHYVPPNASIQLDRARLRFRLLILFRRLWVLHPSTCIRTQRFSPILKSSTQAAGTIPLRKWRSQWCRSREERECAPEKKFPSWNSSLCRHSLSVNSN